MLKATGTTKENVRARIEDVGVIPSIRTGSLDDARFAADTLTHAGIPIVEYNFYAHRAIELVERYAELDAS